LKYTRIIHAALLLQTYQQEYENLHHNCILYLAECFDLIATTAMLKGRHKNG